jgi:hypothetical protein
MTCTKAAFAAMAEAEDRVREIRTQVRAGLAPKHRPTRAYWCKNCGQHHLTSHADERGKRGRRR